MKRLLLSALAAASLAVVVGPAAAYPAHRGYDYGSTSINQREAGLNARIDAGIRSGQITRDEAVRLHAEMGRIEGLERQYRRNGLALNEQRDLERRLDALSSRVVQTSNDRDYPRHR